MDTPSRTPAVTPAAWPTIRTEPDYWESGPDGTWVHRVDPRTLGQVWDELVAALPAAGIDLDAFDYAGPTADQQRDRRFPIGYRWCTSVAARGCSEGWYVHTVVIYPGHAAPTLETLFLAKTFAGWEAAHALVAALNRLLDT